MAATRRATVLGLGAVVPHQSGEIARDSRRSEPAPASARRAVRVDRVEPRAVSLATGALTPTRVPEACLRAASRSARVQAGVGPRDAFLYDQVDGKLDIDELSDQSGMTRAEVLSILVRLEELGLVRLGG